MHVIGALINEDLPTCFTQTPLFPEGGFPHKVYNSDFVRTDAGVTLRNGFNYISVTTCPSQTTDRREP